MTPSQKLNRARHCVVDYCREQFPGETIELRDSVFICGGFYRGRRFRCDQMTAVWFAEEDQLKIHAQDGTCVATWDADKLAARFTECRPVTLSMSMSVANHSETPDAMPQHETRRAA